MRTFIKFKDARRGYEPAEIMDMRNEHKKGMSGNIARNDEYTLRQPSGTKLISIAHYNVLLICSWKG